jgi:hypothetical protein
LAYQGIEALQHTNNLKSGKYQVTPGICLPRAEATEPSMFWEHFSDDFDEFVEDDED